MKIENLDNVRWYIFRRESAMRYIERLRGYLEWAKRIGCGLKVQEVLINAIEEEEESRRLCEEAYNEIVEAVERVTPDIYRQILRYNYIEGYSLKETAAKMQYCCSHIKHLKPKALKAFEEV